MAASTIAKRVSTVRRWIAWIGDPFADTVTWHDVEDWVDDSNMSAATSRYAAVSNVAVFYRWAMREGLTAHDPTVLVERARIRPGLPRPAADVDLAVAVTLADPTMRAALAVMALCGLRCLEVARLEWCDVDGDTLRVRGKGGRVRVVPIPATVVDAFERVDRVDRWVFPWRETGDVSPGRRVSHAVNRYLRSIGSATTAHQLRHWCGTRAYAACGDLGTVQELLGHASPATTRVYAQLDAGRLRAVVDAIALPGAPAGVMTEHGDELHGVSGRPAHR